jgi:hypothetical protein
MDLVAARSVPYGEQFSLCHACWTHAFTYSNICGIVCCGTGHIIVLFCRNRNTLTLFVQFTVTSFSIYKQSSLVQQLHVMS